jgi:hypothetical protein
MTRLDLPDILDMLSCLKEITMVYAAPPEDVTKVSE